MKIKIAGIFMAFLCLAMVTGSAFAAPVVTPNIVKKIDVRTNPSTGYHWEAKYDHSKVKLIKTTYIEDPNPAFPMPICGLGGTQTFEFTGMKGF